ncbi:LytTR family DNA-binding domain-containing protein [Senimuribacter intestinalis]|uniref:LytTR family DNA-binding domain-containing protein n=1 Tax=Senimuribacter intestinalis TaxID=2941507 RepID=UPI002040A46D|nr:LytTR family DNA-binding domain-containing protein [Senimuribacter intestinalis]
MLHLENKSGRFVIPYSRIYYFEKQKRQVLVRGTGGQVLCSFYGKFEEMEALPQNFLRCHNSMIVNMGRVSAIEKSNFLLIDGSFVSISRTYLQESRLGFTRYCMPDVR